MKKRFISILLTLGLLLSLIPFSATPAQAAGTIRIDNTLPALWPTASKASDLATFGYHWDGATSTLTLQDLTVTGSILIFEPGVTLELEGTNVVNYGADGGINSDAPGWLTIKGSGSLALNAAAANSGYAIYQNDGTILIDGIDGCKITINHRTASDPYAFIIYEDEDQPTKVNSLSVINGASLRVEGGGVVVPGRLLIDGAASYMSVSASRASLLETAVMCGMLEINDGELSINDTATGDRITALWAFGTYAGSLGNALRVNGGTLYAAGRYQGADFFGDVYIGNGAKTTFYSVIGDGLIITEDLYFDGDYYFYAASGVSFWGLGFAFRLVGDEIIMSPGSPKIVKGSRYSSTIIDMDILPSYSYFNGIWLGIFSAGWVSGNGNLLKRFKIMPALQANGLSIPDSTVGTAIAPIDFSAGVSGGVTPYTYQFYGPSWLTMDPATGMITGTPTAPAGPTIAMITVTDSDTTFGRPPNTITLAIPVGKVVGPPLTFVKLPGFDIPDSTVLTPIAPVDVSSGVSGGIAPYFYSISGPSWLVIDPLTGVITGTPPAQATATTATVTVADSASPQDSKFIVIDVGEVRAPLTFTNYGWGVPSSETGKPILAVDVFSGVAGGKAPYTFSITPPATWPLLAINPATGVITGTAPATVQTATTAVITVTDVLGATASITIPVGAVSQAQIVSDLTFFHYDEFDVPRSLPSTAISGIDVTSGVCGGDGNYTFSIDYARKTEYDAQSATENPSINTKDPASWYQPSRWYSPTWLTINPATGVITGTPPATNQYATKVQIVVRDGEGKEARIIIRVGPVSNLTFQNSGTGSPGTNKALVTGTTTGSVYTTPPNNAAGVEYDGYHVPAGYPGSMIYFSTNSGNVVNGWLHPHYGIRPDLGASGYVGKFDIIDGPEWLSVGLNGCFWGVDTYGAPLQTGVRPAGPRPPTTVTIKFWDAFGGVETMTLPVGPIVLSPAGTDTPLAFAFGDDVAYDIPPRLVEVPINENPPIDVSRGVVGTTGALTFGILEPTWVQIDPATGRLSGAPPAASGAQAATTITVWVRDSATPTPNYAEIEVEVGAVSTNYLRYEKPAGAVIPADEINTTVIPVDCRLDNGTNCVTGGVEPYVFSKEGTWPSWLEINSSTGIITSNIAPGLRPNTEQAECIVTVKVTDDVGEWRTISVVVGAVTSTPLVFVWQSSFEIPPGVTGTAITGFDVSGAVSGGGAPYTFSKTGGPGWLNVSAGGAVSGTRGAAAPAATATITVTDSAGKTRDITITVGAVSATSPVPLNFVYSSAFDIPTGMVGKAITPVNVTSGVSGGTGARTYSIVGPGWLTINPTTGIISGTPTSSDSTLTATVIVTDSAVPPATKAITITVGAVAVPLPLSFTKQAGYDIPASVADVAIAPVGVIDGVTGVIEGVLGGTIPYTFSMTVADGSTWLSINPATGVITGTPPDTGAARPATTATVTVRDSATPTAASKSITISVGAVATAPLVFTLQPGYSIPARNTGDTFSAARSAYSVLSGGTTPYTFSINNGPTWLGINSTTGQITGIPMDPDTADTVDVTVTDAAGLTATITIPVGAVGGIPLLRFTDSASYDIPARVVGTAVSPTVDVSGGVYGGGPGTPGGPVYTYSLVMADGSNWLSINPATGVISGAPSAPAPATTAEVTVTDNATSPKSCSITINVGIVTPPLDFTNNSFNIPASTRDMAIAPVNTYGGVTGGTRPYAFSMTGPGWLSIDPVTGVITGTPPTAPVAATTAVITVTDNAVPTDSKSITITVGAVTTPLTFTTIPSMNIPAGTEGVAITPIGPLVTRNVNGGTAPYKFSIVGPAWLSIDPANGTLSGTPAAPDPIGTTALITVVDSATPPATMSRSINIGAMAASPTPLSLRFDKLPGFEIPDGTVGMPITLDVSGGAGGGTKPYTFRITGPGWLSINPATGVITGIPTAAANATTATIRVTDAVSAYKEITITVGEVTVSNAPLPLGFRKLVGFDIPAGMAGDAIDPPVNVSVGAYGGTPPYKFTKSSGPAWLNIDQTTGIITGTPLSAATATTATITVTDSASPADSVTIQIEVGAVAAAPPPLKYTKPAGVDIPGGTEGTPVSVNVSGGTSGGFTPYTYSVAGPGWLTINPTTGVLSGTRPGPGPATTATITITDARGNSVSFTITIGAVTAKPVKYFPGGTTTFYRKQQYSVFKDAIRAYGGNGLRFETTGKITVDGNGNISYKWLGVGNTTVTAKDAVTGAVVDTMTVKVTWQWWQWLLVIFLFGWIYL